MKTFKVLLLITLSYSWPLISTAGPICHLHAPDSDPANKDDPSQWLQIYETHKNNLKACERDNARRFSGQGRCYCSFSKIPGLRSPSLNKTTPVDPGEGVNQQIP